MNKLIDLLAQALTSFMPPKIVKLSQLIAQYEGFSPGTRAFRNNNPGNCKFSQKGYRAIYGKVTQDKDGFAIFPTASLGWLYLQNMLLNWAKDERKEWTIKQLIEVYAPALDDNDPIAYSKYLVTHLGVDSGTTLKALIT